MTKDYEYKLWSSGRNYISLQMAHITLTASVAGAGGMSVQWMLLASPTVVCVCVCVCVCVSAKSKHYGSRSCSTDGAEEWYLRGSVW